MHSKTSFAFGRRASLASAIAVALVATTTVVAARDVPAGTPLVLDNVNASTERFNVLPNATLSLLNGTVTEAITTNLSSLVVDKSAVIAASGVALRAVNGSVLNITNSQIVSNDTGARGVGLLLTNDTGNPAVTGAQATVTSSVISGAAYGANIGGDGTLVASGSTITGTRAGSAGVYIIGGHVTLSGGSQAVGQANGIRIATDSRSIPRGTSTLVVDGSAVTGLGGSAILVNQLDSTPTNASISLSNGATLSGANGVALEVRQNAAVSMDIASSAIVGDIVVDNTASADVGLLDGASLTGKVTGNVSMALASNTAWTLRDTSDVTTLALNGGSVSFGQATDTGYHTLLSRGDFSGTGGSLVFNTVLNAGGALGNQQTDRLLINGDVTTNGTTLVTVRGRGDGALTDTNKDGKVDAGEGTSLIQVAGASRADAFQLAGGYVAAGPYQYKLYAFGPGETDPGQKALPGSGFNWDYRLGNSYVCEKECEPVPPVDPEIPGEPEVPGVPGPDPGQRVEVVPQLPAYLSAPAALLTYGDMLNDGLHQRLGDIRESESGDPVGGEMFARYVGGQLHYSSNLSFTNFGYDFDQQVNALQVGGSLIALDGDNGSLRAGWALDHGTTRVTPKAADGQSASKYTANGGAAWVTWQHGSGFWMDGVVSATRYNGDISTAMRGDEVAKIRATGRVFSLEAGMPFAFGDAWILEPQLQIKHQQMNFRDFRDKDGLDVTLGKATQTSTRLGAQLSWSASPVFAPYGRLDLIHTNNGDPGVDVSSEDWDIGSRFKSGRVGNAVRGAVGVTSQLGPHVQLYGEGTYQKFVGSYGMRGWAGYAGVRVSF
jgi:outer membrane autotransporter protein